MASFNKVVLVGNLTRDPNFKSLQSGTSVAEIGLAVTDRRKDANGNWSEEVNFFDVSIFGRNAEVARDYTRKGSPLLVEGRLKQDTWEQEGQKRSKVKVVAERIVLLGSRNSGDSDGSSYQSQGGYQQNGYGYQQSGNQSGYGYSQSGFQQQPAFQQSQPSQVSNQEPNQQPAPAAPPKAAELGSDDIPF